jgi:cytochrome b561
MTEDVPAHTVYARPRRVLHWTIAVLVIAMIPAGLIFTDFDNKPAIEAALGEGAFNTLFDLHKSFGLLILALMAARLWAWSRWPNPDYAEPLPPQQAVASRRVHRGLYVLLFLVPVLGWAGVSAYPAPLPVFFLFEAPAIAPEDRGLSRRLLDAHGFFALAVGALALGHIGAALWHWRKRRDGVFQRMAPRR